MSLYDTNTLAYVARNIKTAPMFLVDRFFPFVVESETKKVTIDADPGKRRMAPFVSPMVQGQIVEERRYEATEFEPAYLKPKRALDPTRPLRRAVGERIGGAMTAGQREMAWLALEMADEIDTINRRLTWMASSILDDGSMTIVGNGYPSKLVDFQRNNDLTIDLSSAARWGEAGVMPSDDLEEWAGLALKHSGAAVADLVFDAKAWALFRKDQTIKDSIWFDRSGDSKIDLGGGFGAGAKPMGNWGRYRLWLYADWYVDPITDVETSMIPDYTVWGVAEELAGTRLFGAIQDPNFGYGAMAYAPRSWIDNDPAQRFLMTQSAPLLMPARPNAMFRARVR